MDNMKVFQNHVEQPAFPSPYQSHHGMTLRDWFAGQALVGLLAKSQINNPGHSAQEAYLLADAILAVRVHKA